MNNKKKAKKLNNSGMTLVEMIVTFALMGLFMVAATRLISYTASIYYNIRGVTYGMEVSNVISSKVVGQLEGAKAIYNPSVSATNPSFDSVYFVDATGSKVTIGVKDEYINIHYDEVTEGAVNYEAVDWKFDAKAYMGYTIKQLHFEKPGDLYPDNVVRMRLIIHSSKYGDFSTSYYIKCVNCERVEYN